MTDSAPKRCCAACRRYAPRTEFIRVVRDRNSGKISIGTGMGRSAYLCPTKECVSRIERKSRLAKVLRSSVCEDIYERLREMVRQSKP